ncbi:MAG: hypothetical protein JNL08_11920 [Planctomycetes bacterium]|nr:hypothetical protein [Planctomycetota bacterium]
MLRIPAALLAATSFVAAQQVVLPDTHHFSESTTQLGAAGSANWWRTTAGRFQVIYEASHFVSAGVTGPVFLTHLRFRGEDGEPNLGGQVYSGVSVQVGATTLTSANMSTTFATNLAPLAPQSTTLGTPGVTNVTVLPSVGSTPNNWCIEIDLLSLGAGIVFDPNGPQPNLLIDITMPTAPASPLPMYLIPIQDTTGAAAVVRGEGVYAATPTATSGTSSTLPPVVGVEFAGAGGLPVPVPARNERYGAACGGQCSTFYQGFANGDAFDLTGLTLLPDNVTAPTHWIVTAGAPPVDTTQLNATPNSIVDDELVTHALGFTHRYPGGSTTTIKPCTNGFVWLDSAMTATTWIPVATELLGATANNTARYLPFWIDLAAGRNTATNPNCGLHVKTDTSAGAGQAVCYVTWFETSLYRVGSGVGQGGHSVVTFQLAIHEATGSVEYRYGSMPAFIGNQASTTNMMSAVVGFTRGRLSASPILGSNDPQSRDLSVEVPFLTQIEGARGHLGLTVTGAPQAGGFYYGGRAFDGQSLTYGAVNVPPGSILAALLLDVQAARPGIQVPTITAPNCMISTSANPLVWQLYPAPGATITGAPIPIAPGLEGSDMYAQIVVLDGLFTGGDLVTVASNAMRHTFGRN